MTSNSNKYTTSIKIVLRPTRLERAGIKWKASVEQVF